MDRRGREEDRVNRVRGRVMDLVDRVPVRERPAPITLSFISFPICVRAGIEVGAVVGGVVVRIAGVAGGMDILRARAVKRIKLWEISQPLGVMLRTSNA